MASVRAHYDRQAQAPVGDVQQALQQRRQSKMYRLKMYHNEIKRRLINRFSQGVANHLDLACGRCVLV